MKTLWQYLPSPDAKTRLRIQITLRAGVEYLATGSFLVVYWMLGRVEWAVPAAFIMIGLCNNVLFLGCIASGLSKRFKDPSMTAVQMFASCCRDLFGMWLAPQLWFLFAFNLFVALPFGSLQFSRRTFALTWLFVCLGLGAAFLAMPDPLTIRLDHWSDRLLLWVYLCAALARLMFFNARISTLRSKLSQMVRELRETQGQLVAAARQAGKAEIATNVLHNVGNVLNSVNVSANLVCDTLRRSRTQAVAQAVRLMEEHAHDLPGFLARDEKGKLLPTYLSSVAQALAQERKTMMEELGNLTRSIEHIKDVVATQQSYAGSSSVVELVQICELVEDALRINDGSLVRDQVTVVKEFTPVPPLRLDRARVLQILVNLISNAKNAMETIQREQRRIVIRVDASSGSRLRVCVKDAGEGIPKENLTRIFAHGFTTRESGHGFGLHSCALAAGQMGGSLNAHSDGPGTGATFTLDLPMAGA